MADSNPSLTAIVQRMIDAGEPEENIATVIRSHSQPQQAQGFQRIGTGPIATGVASGLLPLAERGAMEIARNPNVPRTAAAAGRFIGGLSPIATGIGAALKGHPEGLAALAGTAGGAWAGGKTGWFTGKLLQNIAAPASKMFGVLSPIADVATAAQLLPMVFPNTPHEATNSPPPSSRVGPFQRLGQ